tara:strand:+ start:1239 stop:2261 length:1023 start_codon:yes stop_codon:yes gene_type:complete
MNTGFIIGTHPNNPRLTIVMINQMVIKNFCMQVNDISIQAIEYKPFLRFKIANILDEATGKTLGEGLRNTLKFRPSGAVLIGCETEDYLTLESIERNVFHVLLSTAISHLVGLPNLDSMSGKFYARFTVKNTDDSDSYLRKAHRRMELHTDGTYVDEKTDWVLMQKLSSINCDGGESLLLHVDDWQELDKFYNHPLAKQEMQWGAPPSKNVPGKVHHSVFSSEKKMPCISYIDQFAEPINIEQGLYLNDIGESLEQDTNTSAIHIPSGGILIINNSFWLHGREKIKPHEHLSRELLRQRGVFDKNNRSRKSKNLWRASRNPSFVKWRNDDGTIINERIIR